MKQLTHLLIAAVLFWTVHTPEAHAQSACIHLEPSGGTASSYGTLAAAIAAASSGDSIRLACDRPSEVLTLVGLDDITVYGDPHATIGGAVLEDAAGATLERVALAATGSGAAALELRATLANPLAVSSATATDVTVSSPGLDGVGVRIGPGSALAASRVLVTHVDSVGVDVQPQGVLNAADLRVSGSGSSGVVVGSGASVFITDGLIVSNGLGPDGGWGIEAAAGSLPGDISLDRVVVASNSGLSVPGISTADFGGWPGILDDGDLEVGVFDLSPFPRVVVGDSLYSVLSLNSSLDRWAGRLDTTAPPGLSHEGETAWNDEVANQAGYRDAAFAQYGGGHPSLLDISGTLVPATAESLFSCYGGFYGSIGRAVDYVVDRPRVDAGLNLPPVAYRDIRAALDQAKIGGDLDGDGTIRICVMPGTYGPGIEIDSLDYQVGFTVPAFEIFAAYGPGLTQIQGGPFGVYWGVAVWADNAVTVMGPPGGLQPRPSVLFAGFEFVGSNRLRSLLAAIPDPLMPGSAVVSDNAHLALWRSEFRDHETIDAGGAVRSSAGSLDVAASLFEENLAFGGGGAIDLNGVSPTSIETSGFYLNGAYFYFVNAEDGGAIRATDSALNIETSQLVCNGAIADFSSPTCAPLHPWLDWLVGARPTAVEGGAIATTGATLAVIETQLSANHARSNGGGVSASNVTGLSLVRVHLGANDAHGDGGGLHLDSSTASTNFLDGAVFTGNVASPGRGGGVAGESSTPVHLDRSQQQCAFYDNESTADGGGLWLHDTDLQSDRARVQANHAGADGGGLALSRSGSTSQAWTDTFSVILGNDAVGNAGGGVVSEGVDLDLTGTTVLGNELLSGTNTGHGAGLSIRGVELGDQGVVLACEDCVIESNGFQDRPSGRGAGIGCHSARFGLSPWDSSQGDRPRVVLTDSGAGTSSVSWNQNGLGSLFSGTGVLGGGLFVGQGCLATVDGVSFNNNRAMQGGAVHVGSELVFGTVFPQNTSSELDMSNSEVSGNELLFNSFTNAWGGGVHVGPDGVATISGTSIEFNQGDQGAGLSCVGPTANLALEDVLLRNNTAVLGGGGAYIADCVFEHIGGRYRGNAVSGGGGRGGGLYLEPADGAGAANIQQLEFFENSASGEGGGAYVFWPAGAGTSSATISNVIVGMNESGEGALYIRSDCGNGANATATLSHLTSGGNFSVAGHTPGDGLRLEGGIPGAWTLENSIVAFNQDQVQVVAGEDNVGGSGTDPCDAGGVFDYGLLWNDGQGAPYETFDPNRWTETNLLVADPHFVGDGMSTNPLGGSPDLFNFHLTASSPALTAGQGAAELGAFGGTGGTWSCLRGCP